jgi:uncharacterized protein Yka (UPF0111/DUF47 family)
MSSKRWFLPETPDLLGQLREQAAITVEAMDALVSWSSGDAAAAAVVRDCEHRADETKRRLWRELRDAFSPPLDAEDLYSLSADLDEVLNAARNLTLEMELMESFPDAPTHDMVILLAQAVGELAGAFEHLNGRGDATSRADAAITALRRVEDSYRHAMSALLRVTDLREVMARREVYRRLSRIADLVRTVAERVWYAVVKES